MDENSEKPIGILETIRNNMRTALKGVKGILECPNCHSYKTHEERSKYYGLAGIWLLIAFVTSFTVIGLLVGATFCAINFVKGMSAPANSYICDNCKYIWVPKKEESKIK